MSKLCSHRTDRGDPCRAARVDGGPYCFWHSPEHAQDAAEARRLGGLRRRREGTVSGAYDFEGLGSVEQIRRLLEVAVIDTLGLDSSVARNRTLAYLAQTAVKLLEVGELEERVSALEAALGSRLDGKGGRR